MPTRVVFRPEARQDLLDLHLYVAQHASLHIANGYVDRIEAACLGLKDFPRRGVKRDDLAHGIRTIAFEGRVLIAYRVEDDAIRIIRVLSAGRDVVEDLFG
jgi:toxin ParE1/3/4